MRNSPDLKTKNVEDGQEDGNSDVADDEDIGNDGEEGGRGMIHPLAAALSF